MPVYNYYCPKCSEKQVRVLPAGVKKPVLRCNKCLTVMKREISR